MRTPLHQALRRAALVAALLPAAAGAQVTDSVAAATEAVVGPRTYEVTAVTGWQFFDKAAALENTPTFGLRVVRPGLLARLPRLTIGGSFAFARPTTRGDYFPWNRQIYYSDINRRNDTTLVYEVSQYVSMAHYAAEVGYRFGGRTGDPAMRSPTDWRAVSLDVNAGFGGYAFWLDPEQTRRNELHSQGSYVLGAGIGVPLPKSTFLRIRVDDLIFTSFDREWFSLHDPLFAEELFPNPEKTPPAAKARIHNPRLSVQFSFYPGVDR